MGATARIEINVESPMETEPGGPDAGGGWNDSTDPQLSHVRPSGSLSSRSSEAIPPEAPPVPVSMACEAFWTGSKDGEMFAADAKFEHADVRSIVIPINTRPPSL